ncbi:MAG: M20 family metallo-hydrolase [Myxococcales bacterium]|nr:M20 family metallo-hydrolase [Myxococcales bacterium]MCB9652037.1 M20 family metallo-hydrolase [Deltaproteobacteria bacterium]
MSGLRIDADRLWNSLMTLGQVGAYDDPATGLKGVNRLALTDADKAGRDTVKGWFEAAGLEVRVDRIGNVTGRRPGRRPELAPVLCGSHIDSVPTGGAFDGALGVLGALEVVRTLNAAGVETERSLEIAFFTDEEGARFGTDMLGSATAVGRLELEQAYGLTDERGLTVKGELERIGYLGEVDPRRAPPHAYVECHVEQGPILAAAGLDLGVVTGVQAISWQELTIHGKSAHAGTTPMELRKDAGLIAAKINVHLHEMVASARYGTEMRVTMGRVSPMPNRVNIVPGRVVCTVDLRNPFDDLMEKSERDLADFLDHLEKTHGVQIERRQTARTNSVTFDPKVVARVAEAMDGLGYTHREILSGAGHDAQEMASICPTAMIFVPGEYEGISHNPREFSTPAACARGVQTLMDTLLGLTADV